MGAWVSDNYDQVSPLFNVGYWKVHTAVKKSTQEKVCLWQLDIEAMQKKAKSQNTIDSYVKNCLAGLQTQKRLIFPHILKILDINEQGQPLSFSSEPIEMNVSLDAKLSKDEILYIAKQLAETLDFLHNKAKIAHLCLSPDSLCLSSDFSVKLTNFAFSCQIAEDENSILVLKPSTQPFSVPTSIMSPEQYSGKNVTLKSDVFSFASLICSLLITRPLYERPGINTDSLIPHSIEEETREVFSACFDDLPANRPSFDQIKKCTGICVLSTQVYTYIDQAFSKNPHDKFTFLKGIFKVLPNLSSRLIMKKIVPFLIDELSKDVRFSPAVIPLLINIGNRCERGSFMTTIFPVIQPYLTITNPIELSMSIFACIEILIDLIPEERHFEILYPIYTAALETDSKKLHIEAVKQIPHLIDSLSKDEINSFLIPKLAASINECDASSFPHTIKALSACISKSNPIELARQTFHNVGAKFIEFPSYDASEAILNLLSTTKLSVEDLLKYSVPLASIVISDDNSSQNAVSTLGKFIQRVVTKRVENFKPIEKLETVEDDDEKEEIEEDAKPVVIKKVDSSKTIVRSARKETPVTSEDMAVIDVVTAPKVDKRPKLKTKY